jgi:hypothetical protein
VPGRYRYGYVPRHEARPVAKDYRVYLRGPEELGGMPAFVMCRNVAAWLRVLDQQNTSMCVPFSDALRFWYLEKLLGRPRPILPSPVFEYGETHIGHLQEGTDPLQALSVLQHIGACPWSLDSFSNPDMTAAEAVASLRPEDVAEAHEHRISRWATVPVDLAHLRAVWHQSYPVALAGTVFPAFETPVMMGVSPSAPDVFRLAIGHMSEVAAVVPGSWYGQGALGGHQWLSFGSIPRSYFPQPISEGCNDYIVCATTWGYWVPGPVALFLLPATYLANVAEATVITELVGS